MIKKIKRDAFNRHLDNVPFRLFQGAKVSQMTKHVYPTLTGDIPIVALIHTGCNKTQENIAQIKYLSKDICLKEDYVYIDNSNIVSEQLANVLHLNEAGKVWPTISLEF